MIVSNTSLTLTRVNDTMSNPTTHTYAAADLRPRDPQFPLDTSLCIKAVPAGYTSVLARAGIPDNVDILFYQDGVHMRHPDVILRADSDITLDEIPEGRFPAIERQNGTVIALLSNNQFTGVIR